MTIDEKAALYDFIDKASAYAGNGYRGSKTGCDFSAPETEPAAAQDSLDQLAAEIRACRSCKLCELRKNAVPGEGVKQPLVMVIGEAPGADEDSTGRPFVGKAGQLLDQMLAAISLSRESNCFIANIIKCRPPANRDPEPDEKAACAAFLARQVRLLNPAFILCAGRISTQTLLETVQPLRTLRGIFHNYQITAEGGSKNIPLIATYHPSALLRENEKKRPAWEDLKLLKAEIEKLNGKN